MTNDGWNQPGGTAVITGGANGIGLAAATTLAQQGMNVVIADYDNDALDTAIGTLQAAAPDGVTATGLRCDVSQMADVEALRDQVVDQFGTINCLMNNAGAGLIAGLPWENIDTWKQQIDINLWGIIHGCQAFVPTMLEADAPSIVINTGSKQGITNPPGNYAYNMSKSAVIAYTQSVAHALRQIDNCPISAHLLVPGFTYSGMISKFIPEKPDAAWTCQQTVDYMLDSLDRGDFYILCPDNDVTRDMDEKRIQWNADDLIQNRPALSRWHPDYQDAFEKFMES